jgi:hypothetical protein
MMSNTNFNKAGLNQTHLAQINQALASLPDMYAELDRMRAVNHPDEPAHRDSLAQVHQQLTAYKQQWFPNAP